MAWEIWSYKLGFWHLTPIVEYLYKYRVSFFLVKDLLRATKESTCQLLSR